jgi:CHASE1-domain containing sensor protein
MMKSIATVVVTSLLVLSVAYFGYFKNRDTQQIEIIRELREHGSKIERRLIGFTKYTDYMSAGKTTVSEQAKFLAASVVREYIHNQHITRDMVYSLPTA